MSHKFASPTKLQSYQTPNPNLETPSNMIFDIHQHQQDAFHVIIHQHGSDMWAAFAKDQTQAIERGCNLFAPGGYEQRVFEDSVRMVELVKARASACGVKKWECGFCMTSVALEGKGCGWRWMPAKERKEEENEGEGKRQKAG